MPNNTRTQADGTWVDGYTPPATDWEDLERKVFGSWNGDKGGAYAAPSGAAGDPYVFNGAGFQVTGPTRLSYGGVIYGGSGAFTLRDATWPELAIGHRARTRSIVCPIHQWSIPANAPITAGTWPSRTYLWSTRHPYAGVGSVALSCRQTTSLVIETADLYINLRVVDGALLTKVTIFFRIASKRKLAPIAMPKMRVLRVPRDSGDAFQTKLPEPLKDTTDGLGFDFLPLVTSPDAWYNNGAVQSFDYICDQNHIIDVENYSYVVHLIEETGALSPSDEFDGIRLVERKQDCVYQLLNTVALTGDATNTPDGITTGTVGSRILVTDPDETIDQGSDQLAGGYNSVRNGIWITAAGAWTRATDADDTQDFTPNWIVRINSGGINMNATWQCLYPDLSQRISLAGPTGGIEATNARPRVEPAIPKGNIYHCLVPTFEVSDLRFQ
ncbi:MAG TPA: hypothetical protein PKL08_15450 [Thermoanaerobaculaceae bacterium]|nr:hypothetical protein [Thermoanaerobaculaceae bacterium]